MLAYVPVALWAIVAVVAILTVVISTVQLLNREKSDFYVLYAGPAFVAVQDIAFMEAAIEDMAHDYDNNGQVAVTVEDVVILSPDEQKKAMEAGNVINADYMTTTLNGFYQQIIGGDAVVCMLSHYLYGMVREADGFMPLSEIFSKIPDSAYDEYGILLSEADFGQYYNGINDLPKDTILCIRRLSTMAKFKGEKKTRAAHEASVELFRNMVLFDAPETE